MDHPDFSIMGYGKQSAWLTEEIESGCYKRPRSRNSSKQSIAIASVMVPSSSIASNAAQLKARVIRSCSSRSGAGLPAVRPVARKMLKPWLMVPKARAGSQHG